MILLRCESVHVQKKAVFLSQDITTSGRFNLHFIKKSPVFRRVQEIIEDYLTVRFDSIIQLFQTFFARFVRLCKVFLELFKTVIFHSIRLDTVHGGDVTDEVFPSRPEAGQRLSRSIQFQSNIRK